MTTTQRNIKLSVSRVIKAPREKVFRAWLDPKIRQQWWTNEKNEGPISCEIDGRTGGAYRITQTHDSDEHPEPDGFIWIMDGEFLEVTPHERIVFTWNVNHTVEPIKDQRVTVEFEEVEGGTNVTITHEGVMSENIADGTRQGWTGLLENIAAVM